jgi:hypothetical protein
LQNNFHYFVIKEKQGKDFLLASDNLPSFRKTAISIPLLSPSMYVEKKYHPLIQLEKDIKKTRACRAFTRHVLHNGVQRARAGKPRV